MSGAASTHDAQPRTRLAAVVTSADRIESIAERRIARGLQQRQASAVSDLHELHGRTVMGLLVRLLGDPPTAEDVFQQVFLEAWQRGASYDPQRGSLLTWILTIARSRAIDELRKRVPEPRDPTDSAAWLDEREQEEALADELLEQWRIAGLLQQLPDHQAELLKRRFYGGETQREIAAATGITLSTVKMRMVDGLARLRELLEAEERGS